jgi:peptide/nickel transport system ATP-binding protein
VTAEPLLEVENLAVEFPTPDGIVHAVDGLTFAVHRGETFGIVGESGSGKSVTNLALLGLLNRERTRISGTARFMGQDLISAPVSALREVRGKDIAMIFQDPFACLHPMYTVGDQIVEAVRVHESIPKAQALQRAVDLLGAVGIPNPRQRVKDYPHQYSGGMRQRAMIAMAMINNPDLLIADEPTTALDVTVQAQILELIDRVKQEFNIGVILITHDLGVIAEVAQTVMVMYAGRSMELGSTEDVFRLPLHPYTWGLLESIPRAEQKASSLVPIEGSPPSLIFVPPGCPFHPRCPHRFSPCDQERPEFRDRGGGHLDACHLGIDDKRRLWLEREAKRVKVAV